MSQELQSQPNQQEVLPGKSEVPSQISPDGNSLELGYTAADPNKPASDAPTNPAGEPLLAGKFKSAEELEKAYKELEAKLGQPKEDPPTDQEKDKADDEPLPEIDPNAPQVAGIESTDEAREMLQEKGLDLNRFTREFETTGALSAASYSKLEKAGISREMVDAYIDGQRRLVDSQVLEVKNSVGGAEVYARVHQWAGSGLSEPEKAAYNRMFESNDLTICKAAAMSLKSRYEAAMGKDPAITVQGGVGGGGNDGVGRYESTAQMVEAMRDPRYSTDEAYRAKVERKIANSNF
jgi:hypothetical protein